MANTCLLLPTPSTTTTTNSMYYLANKLIKPQRPFSSYPSIHRKRLPTQPRQISTMTCKASSSCTSSVTEFDLYDLLGIERTANQSQIKMAYRTLQKRCHPDIAGSAGHDMAIILNEAYSVLSNPSSRLVYDKEQAKIEELRGYTGKPIYSVWFGSENERRAVFVDEVKCVGCLKCALFAERTFAIESVYGRARVVAQWADPEHQIQSAIDTCPVDCISVVDRSDLAALEFLMSKQPRSHVRVGAGNSVGSRVSNIFVEVKKFQSRYAEASSNKNSKEINSQRYARMSAVQAIRSISNWLYWQAPGARAYNTEAQVVRLTSKEVTEQNIKKLQEAAAARKLAKGNTRSSNKNHSPNLYSDEYWIPSVQALPPSKQAHSTPVNKPEKNTLLAKKPKAVPKETYKTQVDDDNQNRLVTIFPFSTAALATFVVVLHTTGGERDRLTEHIGGSMALELVNSSWMQTTLAGITWYIIGLMTIRLIEAARSRF